jgi:Ca2+-binding EF-hand superfamily protein
MLRLFPRALRLVAMVLALPVCAGVSAAEEAPDEPEDQQPRIAQFHLLDRDNDGQLSLEEFMRANRWQHDPTEAQRRFEAMDTDKNGFLSLEEFANLKSK